MLVLTRRAGESILIGDDVEVTVLAVDGSKVRLGIKAPISVPVHRREIYLAIHANGDARVGSDPRDLVRSLRRQATS